MNYVTLKSCPCYVHSHVTLYLNSHCFVVDVQVKFIDHFQFKIMLTHLVPVLLHLCNWIAICQITVVIARVISIHTLWQALRNWHNLKQIGTSCNNSGTYQINSNYQQMFVPFGANLVNFELKYDVSAHASLSIYCLISYA